MLERFRKPKPTTEEVAFKAPVEGEAQPALETLEDDQERARLQEIERIRNLRGPELAEHIRGLRGLNNFVHLIKPADKDSSHWIDRAQDIDYPSPESPERDAVKAVIRIYRDQNPEKFAQAQEAAAYYVVHEMGPTEAHDRIHDEVLKPLLIDMLPIFEEQGVDPFTAIQ